MKGGHGCRGPSVLEINVEVKYICYEQHNMWGSWKGR